MPSVERLLLTQQDRKHWVFILMWRSCDFTNGGQKLQKRGTGTTASGKDTPDPWQTKIAQ